MAASSTPALALKEDSLVRIGDVLLARLIEAAHREGENGLSLELEAEAVELPAATAWECVDVLLSVLKGGRVVRKGGRHADRVRLLQDRVKDFCRNAEFDKRQGEGLSMKKRLGAASTGLKGTRAEASPGCVG